jgi:hypothetical protein
MSKYTFIMEDADGDNKYHRRIELKTGDIENLHHVLYHFQSFLEGCGFVVHDKCLTLEKGEPTYNLDFS